MEYVEYVECATFKPKALRGALFIHGKQRRTPCGFHHEKPVDFTVKIGIYPSTRENLDLSNTHMCDFEKVC